MSANAVAPVVRQKIEIPYSYVAGPAMSRFLLGLKEKRFMASECPGCGQRNVPPLLFCGRCWRAIQDFREVGPEGVLESFAAIPASPEPGGAAGPVCYGLIRLDGASTLLAHFVLPGAVLRCGARVRPEWAEERKGSILDLRGFRLLP